jgi:hypothetical protein
MQGRSSPAQADGGSLDSTVLDLRSDRFSVAFLMGLSQDMGIILSEKKKGRLPSPFIPPRSGPLFFVRSFFPRFLYPSLVVPSAAWL